MKTIAPSLLIGALIALTGLALGAGWHGLGRADSRTIHVTGESRLVGEPDLARVMFGVEKSGKTVGEAQQRLAQVVSRVIAAEEQAGVKKEDIATSDLSIEQSWDYAHKRPGGYTVSSTLTLTVREVQHVGRAIDAAVAAGLNRMQGVSYDVRSPEWRAKALREALDSARQKAEALAAGMGRPLGDVVSVQEIGMQQASPAQEFSESEWPATVRFRAAAQKSEMPLTRSLPGQRAMTVQVAVQYGL